MSNDIHLWKMPYPDDVEFIQINSVIPPIPRQVSSAYKLVYFERGAKRFRYCGGGYAASSGDLLLIPPGESHEADITEEADTLLRILQLPEAVFETLLPKNLTRQWLDNWVSPPFVSNPMVISPFRQLHQKPDAFVSEPEQQTRLLKLLEALQTPHANCDIIGAVPRQESGSIRRLKQYIDANYAEEITLAKLAQITGLNAVYLCRAFTQAVGMLPHAYQVAARIDRARAFLYATF